MITVNLQYRPTPTRFRVEFKRIFLKIGRAVDYMVQQVINLLPPGDIDEGNIG